MNQEQIDNLSDEEIGKLFPIEIVQWKPEWKSLFNKEKNELENILGDIAIRIEHFGSTAVPDLAAKQTIDILVEIPSDSWIKNEIIGRMKLKNYYFIFRKDRNPPYIMFIKGLSLKKEKKTTYHIHMADKNHKNLWDRLYFRDYLIHNKEAAKEYENLKIELAKKFHNDRESYTKGKKNFVDKITSIAKTTHNND